jgi:DNA topoisomerase-1
MRELGVDTETWTASYEISADKRKVVAELRAAVKDADFVYIASDNDLEGECIAAHLRDVLKLKEGRYARVTFNEITRGALQAAILAPRDINAAKVEAQETRRILDRVTGYGLSPLLWRRFPGAGGPPRKSRGRGAAGGGGTALSAGRVQSAALRMVTDRARAAAAHDAQKYWTLAGQWGAEGADSDAGPTFRAAAETAIYEADEARAGLSEMLSVSLWTAKFKKKIVLKAPPLPFTTSSLQQEAHARFRMSAKDTMRIAQGLYEAGAITYMRTDSATIAEEAIAGAAAYVRETYSADDVCERPGRRPRGPGAAHAQEAHEAIRPTDLRRREAPGGCDGMAARLYDLIWRRTIASQMAPARYAEINVSVSAYAGAEDAPGPGPFVGKVRILLDPGYQKVLHSGAENTESGEESLKAWEAVLGAGSGPQVVRAVSFAAEGDVTRPPATFQEGTLVKAMEREGIGRPSTYAGILDKLFAKGYVCKDAAKAESVAVVGWEAAAGAAAIEEVRRVVSLAAGASADRLVPTGLGEKVADYLTEVVPDLLDTGFTSRMEADLDKIAEKRDDMSKAALLERFYSGLQAAIARAASASVGADAEASGSGGTPKKRAAAAAGPTALREFAGGVRAVETRYGPALLVAGKSAKAKGRFVALGSFMEWRKVALSDVSEEDVARLVALPAELAGADGWSVAIGRYGVYLTRAGENRRLPEELWGAAWDGTLRAEEIPAGWSGGSAGGSGAATPKKRAGRRFTRRS